MNEKALYYPYICVPESKWFMQMLLYWDEIATIVPEALITNGEHIDEYTKALANEGLLNCLRPRDYHKKVDGFGDAFEKHLESIAPQLEHRRRAFRSGDTYDIHVEKLDNLDSVLKMYGLAEHVSYPWFKVEKATADEFMLFLATVIADQDDFTPITDQPGYIRRVLNVEKHTEYDKLESGREILLKAVLPVPDRLPSVEELRRFKEKYGALARRTRHVTEKEILQLSLHQNTTRHQMALDLAADSISQDIQDLREAMQSLGWVVTLGLNVLGIVEASTPIGFVKALREFAKPKKRERSPVLYAAFAQEKLLKSPLGLERRYEPIPMVDGEPSTLVPRSFKILP